jgi:uncharacterized protein (DUF1684 family)
LIGGEGAHEPDECEDFGGCDAYVDEIEQWRARRVAQLTAPDGWLTLIGLEWLSPGPNRVGSAAENDVVLSTGPSHLGVITLAADGHAHFERAAGADARIDGTDEAEAALLDDMQSGGRPTVVRFGTGSFSLIDRDGHKGVRVRDSGAATRTHFEGLDYYPIDRSWNIDAEWVPMETARTLLIPTTLGSVRERPISGKAVFTYAGQRYVLYAARERASNISFVIADTTSDRETYGGARFLTPDMTNEGRMGLDFNKATNPPCAFTPYATCPLAPPENRLPFPITAGEKMYQGGGH